MTRWMVLSCMLWMTWWPARGDVFPPDGFILLHTGNWLYNNYSGFDIRWNEKVSGSLLSWNYNRGAISQPVCGNHASLRGMFLLRGSWGEVSEPIWWMLPGGTPRSFQVSNGIEFRLRGSDGQNGQPGAWAPGPTGLDGTDGAPGPRIALELWPAPEGVIVQWGARRYLLSQGSARLAVRSQGGNGGNGAPEQPSLRDPRLQGTRGGSGGRGGDGGIIDVTCHGVDARDWLEFYVGPGAGGDGGGWRRSELGESGAENSGRHGDRGAEGQVILH